NKSYFHDFQSNVGKLSYVQTGAYPTIVKNEGNVYYSFMHLLSEPKPIKDRALKLDYIEQYNKLLDEKFENPVIVRFELK
ncbi:MAG TPA: hypothetical protein PKD85_09120, partial [Saprospiraceae bacterium]|nr:hypothetical protein [Saprospiraceae bacterium]